MRKLLSYLLALSAVTVFAGCLKDKEFEDQKYGIQIKEVKAVAFPQAAASPIEVGVNSLATPQVVDGPYVALEEDYAPSSSVTVKLKVNQALATAAGYEALTPTEFSINSLTVTLAAGQKLSDAVKITIVNSFLLNPLKTYGLGLTIESVDQGYKIAANQKDVVIAFSIKNKYDGIYKLTMRSDGWAAFGLASGVSAVYPANMQLVTAGPNSVTINCPEGFDDLQPGWNGGVNSITAGTGFGATTPKYTFDLATDAVISVENTTPDDGRGRTLFIETSPTAPNKYTAATKTLYLEYYMTQNGRPNQKFFMKFEYVKGR